MEGDSLRAEEAPTVDRGTHDELAGDENPHRRRDADARAGVGDGEDDQQPHDPAEEHPPGLVDGSGESSEAAACDDEDQESDHGCQGGRESERAEYADPLAEPRHESDLQRAGEAGRNR